MNKGSSTIKGNCTKETRRESTGREGRGTQKPVPSVITHLFGIDR